ncbi:unnamed protein product, partial [Symbiodinium pilosum]
MEKAASKAAPRTSKPAPLGPVPRRRPPQVKARPRSSSPPPASVDRPKSPKRTSTEAVPARAGSGTDTGLASKAPRASSSEKTGDSLQSKAGQKKEPKEKRLQSRAGDLQAKPSASTKAAMPPVDTLEALYAENSRLKQEVERQRAEIQALRAQSCAQQSAAAEPIAAHIVAAGSRSATPVKACRACSVPPSRPSAAAM